MTTTRVAEFELKLTAAVTQYQAHVRRGAELGEKEVETLFATHGLFAYRHASKPAIVVEGLLKGTAPDEKPYVFNHQSDSPWWIKTALNRVSRLEPQEGDGIYALLIPEGDEKETQLEFTPALRYEGKQLGRMGIDLPRADGINLSGAVLGQGTLTSVVQGADHYRA